ncbi:MAG: glycosyltransferase family 39 protein [Leptospiraceae bacterium]|nr:glycosyltransferase family 39 protein [Leptospiraceae bacterium]
MKQHKYYLVWQRYRKLWRLYWLPWSIIALGIILRLDQYLFNRSLWLDEAFFAVNIVDRSFLELLKAPLEYTSYARPPGFMLLAKLSVLLFGNSEFSLRLVPFLCGLSSLILFRRLARAYISKPAVSLALFFFAISDALIFYATEFKQYSSDVLVVITLGLLAARYQNKPLTSRRLITLAMGGMLAIWFSFTSVFILAGIGLVLATPFLIRKQWGPVFKLGTVFLFWLGHFAVLYHYFIHVSTPVDRWMHQFWVVENAFGPPNISLETGLWFYNRFLQILANPGGLGSIRLAGLVGLQLASLGVIIGCIALLIERKPTLILVSLPAGLALGAAGLHLYPFSGRMLLFLTPMLYLVLAEGISKIQINLPLSAASRQCCQAVLPGSASRQCFQAVLPKIILISFFVFFPVSRAIWHWFHPRVMQEIKPVLAYVDQRRQRNDIVYLYYWAEPAFRYYAPAYGFHFADCRSINPVPANAYIKEVDYYRQKRPMQPAAVETTRCILGIAETWQQARPDLELLQGHGRIWFVFAHINEPEQQLFLHDLNARGTQLDHYEQPGAAAYLYHLPDS